MPISFSPPLRIVVCGHALSAEEEGKSWSYQVAKGLELALMGDPSKHHEEVWEPLDLASAVPLGDDVQFRSFRKPPTIESGAAAFLDEALHTLLVVLVDDGLRADDAFLDWLSACALDAGMVSGRHQFFVIAPGDETKKRWQADTGPRPFGRFQALDFSSLGEEAERLDWLALQVVRAGVQLLAVGSGAKTDWKVSLFVSHAKRDGISLAKSLRDLLAGIPWLQSFYDARDLSSYRPWELQLEEAVASSVLVSLRTDIYDHRPYCQKEVLWAEQYGAPMVMVDARGGLVHAASCLPFEAAPCVRIIDGNLLRILHAALRVTTRSQAFLRRAVELQRLGLLPSPPSLQLIAVAPGMSTIASACRSLSGVKKPRFICYPEPKLSQGRLEAAAALAADVEAHLGTPGEILAAGEAP